jgi:asparagine synthase (glutamine-hydrolysing)
VAVWSLARAARQDVKVVLSGEGSDELFGGYPKHRLAWLTRHAQWAPGATRRAAFAALDHVLPPEQRRLRVAGRALAAESYSERLEGWFSPFSTAERAALLGDVPRRPIPPLPIPDGADPLQAMLYMDTFGGWLSDNLLERGDRMSMAASLELRPPFLDHELVELAFRLPSSVRRRGKTGKWVIKELARRHLPPGIVDRRKSGFRVPLDAWFRDSLRDLAADRLLASDAFVPSVMDRAVLTSLLGGHASGRRNEDIRIWTLLCLEIWHDAFFRSAALEVPADAVPGM